MALQSSTKVRMPVDDAERCWNEFVSSEQQDAPKAGGQAKAGNGKDPGTVYFNKVDDQTTEVTIQLDPSGLGVEGDEKTLGQRVQGYLDRFKGFVEKR
jgi:hypothetical protein